MHCFCVAILPFSTGCAIHISPPNEPREPVKVFIVDYGQHASLLLPRADQSLVEYAYGEWGYFALGRQGWHQAIGAIAWPTAGTLGTRELPGISTVDQVYQHVRFEHLYAIAVEREAADKLLAKLDAAVEAEREHAVRNEEWDLLCVPYPELYCLFCQCNSMVARWLRELNCRVRGASLLAVYRIDPPHPTSAPVR